MIPTQEQVLKGDKRAVARLMSLVENDDPKGLELLRKLYKRTGKARIIGITGPPGVGKSTLVFKVAQAFRKQGKKVGIVAVDPTSPFTGGALLGDRVRMQELSTDDGVFIRSMGNRGYFGGLARRTGEMVDILDAAGMDIVIVETIGTGQAEVDVVRTVHTCCVVLVPGLGDEVQTFKAGILEIGDIFVVNKSDKGADKVVLELWAMLDLAVDRDKEAWVPPIVKTAATTGEGVDDLIKAMDSHCSHIRCSGRLRTKSLEKAKRDMDMLLGESLMSGFMKKKGMKERFDKAAKEVADRKTDPYTAVERLTG